MPHFDTTQSILS